MTKRDALFQDFVRSLPCFVCFAEFYAWVLAQPQDVQANLVEMVELLEQSAGTIQKSPTEFAHLGLSTSRRGLSQKYGNREGAPLCAEHHRGASSHHSGTATFWQRVPLVDRDALILTLNRVYDSLNS